VAEESLQYEQRAFWSSDRSCSCLQPYQSEVEGSADQANGGHEEEQVHRGTGFGFLKQAEAGVFARRALS
jgi:hypothetical protein